MKKKKSTKAVTLLTRIESLLCDAVDQFSAFEKSAEKNARELLVSAEASVSKAKEFIDLASSFGTRPVSAKKPRAAAKSRAKRPARIRRPSAAHA
jgi:hypothetical protein